MDSAHRLEWRSLHDASLYSDFPELRREACEKALHLVTPARRILAGAKAFGEMAKAVPGLRVFRVLYRVPGCCPMMEGLYRLIARHRGKISGILGAKGACDVPPKRRVDTSKKGR